MSYKRHLQLLVPLASAGLLIASPIWGANLILNGSFEQTTVVLTSPGTYNLTPTGWKGGDFLVRGAPPSGFPFYPSPQDGNQYEAIHYGAEAPSAGVIPTLSQTFNVPTAGTYRLTWYDNSGSYEAYQFSISVGGSPWLLYTGTGATAWQARSLQVNLSTGPNTLIFSGGNGYFPYIDNVALELVSGGSNTNSPPPPPPPPSVPVIDPSGVADATNGIASSVWNTVVMTNIPVGSSPFSWTNTSPVNGYVLLGGGSVSGLSLNGTSLPSAFFTSPATLPLQPGQYISVTFTAAPTLYFKPF